MKIGQNCADCFNGLSCKTRIKIINILKKSPKMSVLEITKHFKISQPTMTHHLHYLKKIGILNCQKEGKKVYYFIDPKCEFKDCGIFY